MIGHEFLAAPSREQSVDDCGFVGLAQEDGFVPRRARGGRGFTREASALAPALDQLIV